MITVRWTIIISIVFIKHEMFLLQGTSVIQTAVARLKYILLLKDDFTNDLLSYKLKHEYDFVVIGAGTSGSVVANRLTEVSDWNVLLLEAGGDENWLSDIPILAVFLQLTSFNWGYKTEPEDNACLAFEDRRCQWPRGKGMGGTSIINDMIYTRGNAMDYDGWEAMGNPGWGWNDVKKYFLKSENAQGDLKHLLHHSTGGYLDVSSINHKTKLGDAFLIAGKELGYNETDFNSGEQIGFGRVQVTQRDGERCSASKAFLRPIRDRKNFHVAKTTQATKIIIDPLTNRVQGIEFHRLGRSYYVEVKKEIILSAGAINSPQLLMLSGIGPKEHLAELSIKVIKDVPGVGQNLQDHVAMPGLLFTVNDTVSIREDTVLKPSSLFDYFSKGTGPLTTFGVEALAYVRTKSEEGAPNYPDIEYVFVSGSHNSEIGKWLMNKTIGLPQEYFEATYGPVYNKHAWMLFPLMTRPNSRGWVKLKSKNPFDHPIMVGNYLSDIRDLENIVEGQKMALDLAKTTAFRNFNSTLHETPFPACAHLPYCSDSYWQCAARQVTINCHHQCGTAKMGPVSDPAAVVDHELKVHGIKGLRVVDASIIPRIPAAHTNAVCIMIGEKAADMIKSAHLQKWAL